MAAAQTLWRDPLDGIQRGTLALIVSTLAVNVLSLALPVTTLQVYDRILPNQSTGTLAVLIAGVGVAILVELVLRLIRAYMIGSAGAAYVHNLSCDALAHVLAADLDRAPREAGRIDFHSLAAIRSLKEFHNGHSLVTVLDLAFVPVFVLLIAYIGGLLALVPLAVLAAFVVMILTGSRSLKRALDDREAADDARHNFLIGSLNAAHSVKALAQENYLLRRYEMLQRESCLANFGVSDSTTGTFNATAIFSHLMTACIVGFGALAVIGGTLTVGGLIATVLLSGRIMQPVQRGLLLWARYQDYRVAESKVEAVFHAPAIQAEVADAPPEAAGSLDVENLSFAYAEPGDPVLDGLNLSLRLGDAISITGAPGSGKTTLLKLIAGIHRPTGGRVLVDGLDATFFPPRALNDHLGYLTPEGTIFRGTIRDNITRFGDVPLGQAMYVARLMGADREFARLPAGLDTRLEGTGADTIPPGLKQRISIIRVLATRPRILLFDNADRGLDLDGYNVIYDLLARLHSKTSMVIVSDDRNLREVADRHFLLAGGQLTEIDSSLAIMNNRRTRRSVRL